jgi:hypothetical protein
MWCNVLSLPAVLSLLLADPHKSSLQTTKSVSNHALTTMHRLLMSVYNNGNETKYETPAECAPMQITTTVHTFQKPRSHRKIPEARKVT